MPGSRRWACAWLGNKPCPPDPHAPDRDLFAGVHCRYSKYLPDISSSVGDLPMVWRNVRGLIIQPDWRVFSYFAGSILLAGSGGLVPGIESLKVDLLSSLKGHRRPNASRTVHWNLRALLIAAQIAFSLVLLGAPPFSSVHDMRSCMPIRGFSTGRCS